MKSKKLLFLEKILRFMATVILKRHKPKIVAITGSVGKTSARTAVFAVLSSKYNVRENHKNYNNEIGIPLTIIGSESGGKNILKWMLIFLRWLWVLIFPKYPEILIFELGVDRPNDMKYFMSFIHPNVGIITNISLSHIEFFKTIENIAKEKSVLAESLNEDGYAILNADDKFTKQMAENLRAGIMTFGWSENATFNVSHVTYNYQGDKPDGISFKLNYNGTNIPIRLRNLLAEHYVYAALVGIAVGTIFKVNLVDAANSLENLQPQSGRLNLFKGINGSSIIDDTYNASPLSMDSALNVLGKIKCRRKIAVLGDMLELGDQGEKEHRQVGEKLFALNVDIFIAVGENMQYAIAQMKKNGFPVEKIFHFNDPSVAAETIEKNICVGDLILVKGSQGMRMEKIVEKILDDDKQIENILCRQNPEWKKISFKV
jgi:UDP-N-acetylmuramoyl-tripeptide--D-alanyl-D-alanine ligase